MLILTVHTEQRIHDLYRFRTGEAVINIFSLAFGRNEFFITQYSELL